MLLNSNDENYLSQKIIFSPNPFKNELTISSEFNFENLNLKMYNSLGQLVKEVEKLNGPIATITRENLKSGIYFIQISQNEKIISSNKIIVAD